MKLSVKSLGSSWSLDSTVFRPVVRLSHGGRVRWRKASHILVVRKQTGGKEELRGRGEEQNAAPKGRP